MVVLSCRGAALQFVIYIQEMAAATSDAMLMKHWECELVHAEAMLSQLQRKRNGGYGQFWECGWRWSTLKKERVGATPSVQHKQFTW